MNCVQCGQLLDGGAQFCGNCGHAVATVAPVAPSAPAVAVSTMPAATLPPGPVATAPTAVAQTVASVTPVSALVAAGDPHANSRATAALVLGVMSLIAWLIPLIGLPITVTGLVMGILGRRSQQRGLAMAGLVMSSLGLAATLVTGVLQLATQEPASPGSSEGGIGQSQSSLSLQTDCYHTAIAGDYAEVTDADACQVDAVSADRSAKLTLKAIDAPAVNENNLAEAAKTDIKYVQTQTPGSTIASQAPAMFAGQKAYRAVLRVHDQDQSAVIYYVYRPQGYLVGGKTIKLFAVIYSTVGENLQPVDELEKAWQWQ